MAKGTQKQRPAKKGARRARASAGEATHRATAEVAQTSMKKDPLDLRDRMYEPSLGALPRELDHREYVPVVLDQGQEGACTGFGLAAVVNFLLFHHPSNADGDEGQSVSPRMLYELAKRYDEWEGEDYEGSSIRAAMKAWNRHGVCEESLWPNRRRSRRLTGKIQLNALHNPLGSYYRVRHLHLNHMHSALNEVGILVASASVHRGWDEVGPDGVIPFSDELLGGHAFAIVGYDLEGFWIQNSWGPDWGANGFCRISYDDWLQNGWDCWVARLGVPTLSSAARGEAETSRISTFDYVPHESVVMADIQGHFVNLGNDGKLSEAGRYATQTADVDEIFKERLPATTADWAKPRLLLYAHGGLNSEKSSATRVASMKPYFLQNKIYPLHFMWETGLKETLLNILSEAFRNKRFLGWRDSFRERFEDLLDEGIELAARPPGRRLWSEMQENAERASHRNSGADIVARRVKAWLAATPGAEVHLVGHSAGSILHAHLVPLLAKLGVPVTSLTLYAPACSVELFNKNVVPLLTRKIQAGEASGPAVKRCTVFNLSDKVERADKVGPVYKKSLLYLVSEAFEEKKHVPLLGMDKFLAANTSAAAALGKPKGSGSTCVIRSKGGPNVTLASHSESHGGFDNDDWTLNSTLRIIRGKNTLKKAFPERG